MPVSGIRWGAVLVRKGRGGFFCVLFAGGVLGRTRILRIFAGTILFLSDATYVNEQVITGMPVGRCAAGRVRGEGAGEGLCASVRFSHHLQW